MDLTGNGGTADMSQMPAGTPPPGVTPNLGDGAPSQQAAIIGTCTTFIILTTAFVAMRLYVAFSITKIRGLDTYFCALAVPFSFAYMAILMHLSYTSRHMWDTPMDWMFAGDEYWKLRFAQNLLNPLAFFFSRVPVFLLYVRIFGTVRWFRWASYGGIIAAFIIYVHTVPIVAAFCAPQGGWRSMDTFAKCSKAKPDSLAQGAGNIALDLYALLLPLPIISGLQMPLKRKIGVAIVFLAGSFALVASCVSLYYRYELTYGDDTNWNEGAYDASSAVEINMAIICSCMPSLSSLLNAKVKGDGFFASLRSAFSHHSRHSSDASSKALYDHRHSRDSEVQHKVSIQGGSWSQMRESTEV